MTRLLIGVSLFLFDAAACTVSLAAHESVATVVFGVVAAGCGLMPQINRLTEHLMARAAAGSNG